MGRPTPQELEERREQMNAVNTLGGGGQPALAPQPNPSPTTSGSGVPANVSTPAAAPAIDTTGAGGAGPDSPPPQKGNRNLLEDGGSPADMDLDIEGLEKSVSNVANGSTPTAGALEGNGEASDPDVAAAKLADEKVKLTESLKSNGVNAESALKAKVDEKLARLNQLEKDGAITPETHTKLRDRWKNIFNVIPKEDFGMVLMDFGMRAMMAGETMGDMAAIGAAGSGALAGVAQRKEQDYKRGVEQIGMAGEEARADMGVATAAEAESKKGTDTINTDKGIMKYNPETGDYDTPVLNPDGTSAMPPSMTGRPPVDKWKIEQWQKAYPDMSDQEATDRVLSGVTPEEAEADAKSGFSREFTSGTVFIPGKGRVSARNVTDADRRAYVEDRVRGQTRHSGGSALGGDDGGDETYEWKTTKPPSWSAEQWDAYEAQRKESTGT